MPFKNRRILALAGSFGLAAALVGGVLHALPHWFPQFQPHIWGHFGEPDPKSLPAAVADLPLVTIAGADPAGPVAIMMTGNAGWWTIDEDIAEDFRVAGISTIGWNSLAYFLHPRAPEEVARDIDRVAALSDARRDILLVGYSFGADILATVYARLAPSTQARVRLVSLLGLSREADFGIGPWKILARRLATTTRADAIAGPHVPGPHVQCFEGRDEGMRSACRLLDPQRVEIVSVPGGHHFDGDYAPIARQIVAALRQAERSQGRIAIGRRASMMAPANGHRLL